MQIQALIFKYIFKTLWLEINLVAEKLLLDRNVTYSLDGVLFRQFSGTADIRVKLSIIQ